MQIFITTATLFTVFFVVHFILWKISLPRNQTRALLLIQFIVFLIWLALSLVGHPGLSTLLYVAMYYWSVGFCYIITYSAIEGDSPTLSLMRFLAASAGRGRSTGEIAHFMAERPFIGARLNALLNSGMIRLQDDRYVIAGKESFAFRLILGFRRLYGPIPKGG
jgi:hypothetical protein